MLDTRVLCLGSHCRAYYPVFAMSVYSVRSRLTLKYAKNCLPFCAHACKHHPALRPLATHN